jgi:soluble lytic murein transglycosylase-like protein
MEIHPVFQQLFLNTVIDRWSARIAETMLGDEAPVAVQTSARNGTSWTPSQFDAFIQDAATRYELPEDLLRSVIKVESNFRPDAESHAGAKGLMQLMDGTARWLGVEDSFDPQQNIEGGASYLRSMLNRYESLPMALAAYNAGPGAVDRHAGIPPYEETQRYVRQVLRHFGQVWEV